MLVARRREPLNLLLQLQHPAAEEDVPAGKLRHEAAYAILLRHLRIRAKLTDGDEDAARPSDELEEGLQQLLKGDRLDPNGNRCPPPVRRDQRFDQLQGLRLYGGRFKNKLQWSRAGADRNQASVIRL